MNQIRITDISSIDISSLCLETWPCEHSMKITMKDGTLVRPKQYVNSYDIIMLCHMANIDHPKHLNRAYTDLLNRHGKLETSHIDYEDGTFVFAA